MDKNEVLRTHNLIKSNEPNIIDVELQGLDGITNKIILNKYRVTRNISKGSLRSVFRCIDISTDNEVILKISEQLKELGKEINCVRKLNTKQKHVLED